MMTHCQRDRLLRALPSRATLPEHFAKRCLAQGLAFFGRIRKKAVSRWTTAVFPVARPRSDAGLLRSGRRVHRWASCTIGILQPAAALYGRDRAIALIHRLPSFCKKLRGYLARKLLIASFRDSTPAAAYPSFSGGHAFFFACAIPIF